MKKVSKNSRTNDLLIDLVEYMFTEWLVRRGVFTAFKSNYENSFSLRAGFRERLRDHIRRSLNGSSFGVSHLITTSFLFTSTPEGFKFWVKQSAAWERFCTKLQVKL